jgi:hypothetical protein
MRTKIKSCGQKLNPADRHINLVPTKVKWRLYRNLRGFLIPRNWPTQKIRLIALQVDLHMFPEGKPRSSDAHRELSKLVSKRICQVEVSGNVSWNPLSAAIKRAVAVLSLLSTSLAWKFSSVLSIEEIDSSSQCFAIFHTPYLCTVHVIQLIALSILLQYCPH